MKTLFKMMSVAFLAIVFSACSSNNPESVAVDFTEALYTGNMEKAATYCTEGSKNAVEMISKLLDSHIDEMKESDPDIKVVECKISEDGESAKVKLELKNILNNKTGEISDEVKNETIKLKKIGDNWKVVFTK